MAIKLVSSDLNGTLVHQHTMSDMIRLYLGEDKFQQADAVFKRQTSGTASMEEAFEMAGPLTKGLTLRQAIDYAQREMKYLLGFEEFLDTLSHRNIPFVINSTGYSVTIHAMRARWGADKIYGFIGNVLEFGMDGDPQAALREDELEQKVMTYVQDNGQKNSKEKSVGNKYDLLKATGNIKLGITNEDAKATLLLDYASKNFPTIQPEEMLHMGDTMGDSGGIIGVAKAGGVGIAFNYNQPLREFIEKEISKNQILQDRIYFVELKSESSDVRKILPYL